MFQEFDGLVCEQQTWLKQRGAICVRSGIFLKNRFRGSLHTDYGPEGHEKASTNQDFVLAWRADDRSDSGPFVLALADGLTSSFQSGKAAELACWVAMRTLVENKAGKQPMDRARGAFNAAGLALGELADRLHADSDPWHAMGHIRFQSTWKYILANGKLLQTTLMLTWIERDHLRIALVGDGGAVCREADPHSPRRRRDEILAECDLTTQHVNALGPANQSVTAFDCWKERALHSPFMCAFYTDGIGRGLSNDPAAMLDELENLEDAKIENPAHEFIRNVIRLSPDRFADNLSLAVVHSDQFEPLTGRRHGDQLQRSQPSDPPDSDRPAVAAIR
jgi:serine/threonine protein phosphatase PrpC